MGKNSEERKKRGVEMLTIAYRTIQEVCHICSSESLLPNKGFHFSKC